uniref:Glutamine--tRNA ligase n=1 Tax=Candidatus Kentrum eta TaxID=2126337 RepID=A0A450UMS8_9GAMM|nr:MAG: glutaminyl-tRNA synthetase [Candidatus Kentron sp. H]VFJ93829.1 MAG: glutaminyl-tRNA synthetase [Candidatus Kentron sp. H]VFK00490.1 MAG: glutaminyl-tRNA synthetase [Candidatus Kentron sp. H]
MNDTPSTPAPNFIRHIIDRDLADGKNRGRLVTRFPPEPNGYLHIGHAKSICLNFGLAQEHPGARCYLRFDDTNPLTEEEEYVGAIEEDVRWLGFDWGDRLRHASDYFEQLHACAIRLIENGKAYVCDLNADEIRQQRGTLTEPGVESPYRNRSVAENLDLFARMGAGEFPDGARVLRARIDMASPNLNLRDPALYRIRRATHYRAGDTWCIYPMYDFTHPISDALECVTHSLCTLEFEDHRPLYDWVLDNVLGTAETAIVEGGQHSGDRSSLAPALTTACRPRQIEFSRLSLEYTVMSKRLLTRLVAEGHVAGWDDPRMPTLSGLRRRGYTPASLRDFAERVGITKKDHVIEMGLLEHCIREDLETSAPRRMAVLRPLKLVIVNYPEGESEELDAQNHPNRPEMGTRKVPFSRTLFIERDDFMEDPPKKYFRLAPGREVRLRFAYFVTCVRVVKDPETGEVTEVHGTYDPATRGGGAPDGRKVKGTIHWVCARHALKGEARLYDRLFRTPYPGKETGDFLDDLNPDSLTVLSDCRLEPALGEARPADRYQFERLGYFCPDQSHSSTAPVFNRTVALRDSWAKIGR